MQLLIQRGQGRIIILPIFDLWAKFELDLEEEALINKYHVRKHILVEGKPLQRWRAAIFGIIIAGVIAAIIHNFRDCSINTGFFLKYLPLTADFSRRQEVTCLEGKKWPHLGNTDRIEPRGSLVLRTFPSPGRS